MSTWEQDGWSITRATDFINNANVTIDFQEIAWDNYDLSKFKFKNLADLFGESDELVDDLSG